MNPLVPIPEQTGTYKSTHGPEGTMGWDSYMDLIKLTHRFDVISRKT